ncbi:hypothetical protein K488DRAFT_92306 [Vararia minispora EC-137]|uniref:Uncharacterized protein n=1 Tax=Vararia minispora EC-137 TaxID=1314806 RepID=A0ACB8Q472_9AGAM|nr:hypothetical protein K488DRAFT_92306 [Vararia minispora EC-137]
MAVPTLPPLVAQPVRRTQPSVVPPTPTRLRSAIAPSAAPASASTHLAVPSAQDDRRGVPISATLAPRTPAALQAPRPAAANDKDAFLAPFAAFYDTLRDAQELKAWLAATLQRAERAQAAADQADERIERRVAPMRDEIAALRRRVGELEDALARRGADDPPASYRFPAPAGPANIGSAVSTPSPPPNPSLPSGRKEPSAGREATMKEKEKEKEKDVDAEKEKERCRPASPSNAAGTG